MSEHITPDEMAYHAKVVENFKAAQTVLQTWAAHLAAKYELQPEAGDGVDEAGAIRRAPRQDV